MGRPWTQRLKRHFLSLAGTYRNCAGGVTPWGDLILAEDGVSPHFIVGVTPDGKIYKLARTTLGELTGACFSPDGTTLFVNIQTPGVTVAITGPWQELRATAI